MPPELADVVIKATVAPLSQTAPRRREGSIAICIGPAPRYRRSGRRATTVPKSNGGFPRPPEPAPFIGATGHDTTVPRAVGGGKLGRRAHAGAGRLGRAAAGGRAAGESMGRPGTSRVRGAAGGASHAYEASDSIEAPFCSLHQLKHIVS